MNGIGGGRRPHRFLAAGLFAAAAVVLLVGRLAPGLEGFAAAVWLVTSGLLVSAVVAVLLANHRTSR